MLIAIEGIDGSGKGTQTHLLARRLSSMGHAVELVEFPQYDATFFGREIGLYLNGAFGSLMSVHAKLGALLYAGDRYETRDRIQSHLDAGGVVLCDRYTPSNQAHHAAKLPRSDWENFFAWVEHLEYEVFAVPRPDLVIFLDLDATQSAELIKTKPMRTYTTRAADIHEISERYQHNVHAAYQELIHASQWPSIRCSSRGKIKSRSEIASAIWQRVEPLLVQHPTHLQESRPS